MNEETQKNYPNLSSLKKEKKEKLEIFFKNFKDYFQSIEEVILLHTDLIYIISDFLEYADKDLSLLKQIEQISPDVSLKLKEITNHINFYEDIKNGKYSKDDRGNMDIKIRER